MVAVGAVLKFDFDFQIAARFVKFRQKYPVVLGCVSNDVFEDGKKSVLPDNTSGYG